MSDVLLRLRSALRSRYAIEGEVGAGGSATVYVAEDLKHGRKVAVKVFRPELGMSIGSERFFREVAIAAQLQHPHILPVHDSGQADGFLYYVMPYVDGPSLRDRLLREGDLSIPETVRILRDVADALAYAHRHGVIHRDIKPENVMLSGRHAMVTDFGVAKALTEATDQSRHTTQGVALGTPTYMAPEQGTADPHTDHRADIYGFGVVAYEMLTGGPPFSTSSAQAMLAAHLTTPVESVAHLRSSIPPGLAQLVMKCLEKKPADRPQTADELVAQLEALSTPTGGTSPASLRASPRRSTATGRWAVMALVAVGLVGVLWTLSHLRAGPGAGGVAPLKDAASIAILECRPDSGYDIDAFRTQGLTQQIISRLSQVSDLVVINASSVLPLSGAGLTTRQVADTLGVRYVFECSVTQTENVVRVFGQLVDARTRAVRWANPFERAEFQESELGNEIAQQVALALVGQAAVLRPVPSASQTTVAAASQALLEGNYQLHRRAPDALRASVDAYRRAIATDPGFAPAYAALASAFGLSLTYSADLGQDAYAVFAEGLALASRAVELDSTLAEGYAIRGYIETKAYGPSDEIAADFAKALRYAPNSADVRGWYAHFLHREGRHADGLAQAERAITLDPIAPGRRVGFAIDAIAAGRFARALTEADHALSLEPGLATARRNGAIAALLGGDFQRCRRSAASPAVLALCLHSLGDTVRSQAIADSIETSYGAGPAPTEVGLSKALDARDLACYYGWAGDARRAAMWVERAFSRSPTGVDFRLLRSPLFGPVGSDVGFRETVAKVEADVWRRTTEERKRVSVPG